MINGGYGYPTFVFYPIVFFYCSAILNYILPINEYQSAMIFLYILSLISVVNLYYFLTETVVDKLYAWFGIVLYVMIPYHYALLYIRGDFSEYMALSLLPVVINLFYRFVVYEKIKYFVLLIGTLSLGIISHPIFITVFIPVFILFILYFIFIKELRLSSLFAFCISLIIALALTSYYWLNFILLIPEINISKAVADFHATQNLMDWYELVNMVRGSSHYYQIGFLYIFLAVITLVQWNRKAHWIFGGLMILWVLSLTKEFNVIIPIWEMPLISSIQFPWRMLGIISLILVLYITNIRLGKKHELFLNLGIYAVLMLCLQSSNFMAKWNVQQDNQLNVILSQASLQPNSVVGAIGSISNEYASKPFLNIKAFTTKRVESLFNHSKIEIITENAQSGQYKISVKESDYLKINRMQLSNWIFKLNQVQVQPELQNGLYFIKVNKGTYIFEYAYEKPFNFSMYLVLLTVVTVILGLGLYADRYSSKNTTK